MGGGSTGTLARDLSLFTKIKTAGIKIIKIKNSPQII